MRTIKLTQGKVALVDDFNYDWLNQYRWFARVSKSAHTFYAGRQIRLATHKKRCEHMHRLILGLQPDDKLQCDHRDGNGLNNQRANLRACTMIQNQQSSRKRKVGTSRYKGVCWHRDTSKWCSYIRVNKKRIHLGLFNSEIDAARACDAAALKYHGQFALTNKMLGLL